MAPADNADTPDFISVPANVCAPIVAPAVVEAVAPAIRIPAIGATVITEMSINTPTAQIIIVASDIAASALFSPVCYLL